LLSQSLATLSPDREKDDGPDRSNEAVRVRPERIILLATALAGMPQPNSILPTCASWTPPELFLVTLNSPSISLGGLSQRLFDIDHRTAKTATLARAKLRPTTRPGRFIDLFQLLYPVILLYFFLFAFCAQTIIASRRNFAESVILYGPGVNSLPEAAFVEVVEWIKSWNLKVSF
jgi:hypothetical protein